jgi:hypothetical protein
MESDKSTQILSSIFKDIDALLRKHAEDPKYNIVVDSEQGFGVIPLNSSTTSALNKEREELYILYGQGIELARKYNLELVVSEGEINAIT